VSFEREKRRGEEKVTNWEFRRAKWSIIVTNNVI
jgi:hypothetical protein